MSYRLHRKFSFFRTDHRARRRPRSCRADHTLKIVGRPTISEGRMPEPDAGRSRWQQRFDQAAQSRWAGRDTDFTTLSGVEVDPVYGPPPGAVVPDLERI